MGQASRAVATEDVWFRSPANDNDPGPGDTDANRWHLIITRLKAIYMPAAVQAATYKLGGMPVDEFIGLMRQAIEALGWPQAALI